MTSKRMRLMLPEIAWSGVSIAYYAGMLVFMMTKTLEPVEKDTQVQYKKAMLAMVAFGFGEILGGPFMGYVVDKYSSKVGSLINVGVIIIMTAVTYAFLI